MEDFILPSVAAGPLPPHRIHGVTGKGARSSFYVPFIVPFLHQRRIRSFQIIIALQHCSLRTDRTLKAMYPRLDNGLVFIATGLAAPPHIFR